MDSDRRERNYRAMTGGKLTARQQRRIRHKRNRALRGAK